MTGSWGVTLRDRQREHFYKQLDQRFPGLRARYEQAFGGAYMAHSPHAAALAAIFTTLAARCGLARTVPPYCAPGPAQLTLL